MVSQWCDQTNQDFVWLGWVHDTAVLQISSSCVLRIKSKRLWICQVYLLFPITASPNPATVHPAWHFLFAWLNKICTILIGLGICTILIGLGSPSQYYFGVMWCDNSARLAFMQHAPRMHHEIFHLGSQHSCLYRLTAKAVIPE
jgi:hypothetical protein